MTRGILARTGRGNAYPFLQFISPYVVQPPTGNPLPKKGGGGYDPDAHTPDALFAHHLQHGAKHGALVVSKLTDARAQAVKHRMVGIRRYRHDGE